MQVQEEARWTMRRASEHFRPRALAANPEDGTQDMDLLLRHPLINEMMLGGLSLRLLVVDVPADAFLYASPTLDEFWNPADWDAQMAQGCRYADTLLHPDDNAVLAQLTRDYLQMLYALPAQEQPFCKHIVTYRMKNRQGEYRKLLQQRIPFFFQPTDTSVRYMAIVLQDITLIKTTDEVTGYVVHRQPDGEDRVIPQEGYAPALPPRQVTQLTAREREVLRLVVQGHSSKMIADELHISPETVAVHRRNLMRKTGCANAAQLSAFALQAGLV